MSSEDWQPIDTAPRDGTVVLGSGWYDGGRTSISRMRAITMKFASNTWWRDNCGAGWTVQCDPTHWMPFAEPRD